MTTRQRLRDYTRQLQAGYSYVRMLDASGKLDRSLAPNEMAYSDEIAHQCGVKMMRASNSFFVPAQRDMTIATASSGGYLASTAAEAPPACPLQAMISFRYARSLARCRPPRSKSAVSVPCPR